MAAAGPESIGEGTISGASYLTARRLTGRGNVTLTFWGSERVSLALSPKSELTSSCRAGAMGGWNIDSRGFARCVAMQVIFAAERMPALRVAPRFTVLS